VRIKDLTASEVTRLSALLDEAMDLDPVTREQWLGQLQRDDPRLVAFLRQLFMPGSADILPETNQLLDRGLASLTEPEPGDALCGREIGPYRILSLLGRGGMGTVWLARRQDDLIKRPVALKLPHPGIFDEHLAERFAREREILAALTHNHIARLYDAGIGADGQPYLALEYIAGLPLTEYCDRHRLPVSLRLMLFMQVLSAVQYAHTQQVIHRDLKPSNILVTAEGSVQLLDFGVAKLIKEGSARETELTQLGGKLLTPDYAAPEQIAGQEVSGATDVYALGVILYELLTGERPYRLKRKSRGALEEAILALEPPRPSAVTKSAESVDARATTVKKLNESLHGDLDTIALKALKKRPEDRYNSVAAFAEDLLCYFADQPVKARPDSPWYRARKFASRNKLVLAAVAVVLASLLAGLIVALNQAHKASEQALAAQREAKHAEAVQQFLLDIFRSNSHLQQDPQKARQATARELLDIGVTRIDAKLKDAPEVEEDVLNTLGDMYIQMGLDKQAADLRLQRASVLKRIHGPNDPRVADALLDYIEDIAGTPDRLATPTMLAQAKSILDAAGDHTSLTRAALWMETARWNMYLAPALMQEYADKAVLLTKHYPNDFTYPLSLEMVAWAREETGAYREAAQGYAIALVNYRRLQPGPSAWEIFPLAELANTQYALLDIPAAEQSYRQSLAITQRLNGESHHETLMTEVRFGAFLYETGRRAEGEALLQRALAQIERDPVKQQQRVATVVYGLYGRCLLSSGALREAEPYLALAAEGARRLYPEAIPYARALLDQSLLLTALGRYDSASQAVSEAVRIWQRAAGRGVEPALSNPFLFAEVELALAQHDALSASAALSAVQPSRQSAAAKLLDETRVQVANARIQLLAEQAGEAAKAAAAAVKAIEPAPWRSFFPALEADARLQLQRAENLTSSHR
jgi:serine/threonine-protein kinase